MTSLCLKAHAAPAGAPAATERFAPRSSPKHLSLASSLAPFGAGRTVELGRSDLTRPATRALDAAPFNAREENALAEHRAVAVPFPVRWQTTPEIVRQVGDIRRRGLPIVRLWQSTRALLAIGLNKHGVPGIYITQRVPD